MIDNLYTGALLVGWSLLFVFGGYFLLGKIPDKRIFDTYKRSRRILGVALLFFGLQVFLQWAFNFRTRSPHIAAALNLSCFYLEGILFGMSFTSLLDKNYLTKKLWRREFTKYGIYEIVIWIAALLLSGTPRSVMLGAAALFFFVDASRIALVFFKTYHKALQKMHNYYSDNLDGFIRWLSRTIYGIVFFGLIAAVLAFAPKQIIAVYMALGDLMFIYIFVSFQDYIVNYEQVETATEMPKEEAETETIVAKGPIESHLKQWIDNESYKQCGINIEQVALAVGTNRTYLSAYINNVYKCTFREWIVGMRIENAKQVLLNNKDISITQLSEDIGFASSAHFSRTFSQHEGVAPTRWREENFNIEK